MKYKIMVLYIALSPLWAFSGEQPKRSAFEQKLEDVEAAVEQTDFHTAYCQQSTNWHFPAELYRYIENARYCYLSGNKKEQKKAGQYIEMLIIDLDLAIEGESGYWAGNAQDVWIDPKPPVPDCALREFITLRANIARILASTSKDVLVHSQESSLLMQSGQTSSAKESP